MNAPTIRETLRFAGERIHELNETNPWPQPAVISHLTPDLTALTGTTEYLDFKRHAIACVAYHRWQAHGSRDGRADEDWLGAETELMQYLGTN